MANAFDRVNISFILVFLQKFGFAPEFIDLIKACIRGLRQGYLLSPFLYISMVESLSKNLEHCKRNGSITGIFFSKGVKSFNHSLFVDDTLFLGGAPCVVARRFKSILDIFLEVFGCLLNNSKSSVYIWNVPARNF